MEAQVRTLEMKFMRRKQDMQRTVDDIRDSSKIERSRISALHQQVRIRLYARMYLLNVLV